MKTGPSPSLLCSELRVSSDTLQLREDLCEEARLGIDPQHRPTGQMKANYFQQFWNISFLPEFINDCDAAIPEPLLVRLH